MLKFSMEALERFLTRIRRLSAIERCSNTLHIQRYNVAEHGFYTAFLTMLFADLENERLAAEEDMPSLYDVEIAIRKALIHDIEESITGDILYPIKNESEELSVLIKTVINRIVNKELFEELPDIIGRYYKQLWYESKDDTKEGLLVAAIDKLEIFLFAEAELALGNNSFKEMYEKAKTILLRDFGDIESITRFITRKGGQSNG